MRSPMWSFMRKFTQRHDTDASTTRKGSRKGLTDVATQKAIGEKSMTETHSEIMQDKTTQVSESLLRAEDVQTSKTSCPLQSLPTEITLQILKMLDTVSLICLRMTSQRLRRITAAVRTRDLNRCVRWRINCHLEKDSRAKGAPLPPNLQCAFCKRAHEQYMFGLSRTKVGYGIENLAMTKQDPEKRHCWLHMPKRFCYSPAFRDPQQRKWAQKLEQDRWIATAHMVCLHCGTRLQKNVETGEEECPVCMRKCDVCGYIKLAVFCRFGPERSFEIVERLRLVRRKKAGFVLEIEDRNGGGSHPYGGKYSQYSVVEFPVLQSKRK